MFTDFEHHVVERTCKGHDRVGGDHKAYGHPVFVGAVEVAKSAEGMDVIRDVMRIVDSVVSLIPLE